MTACDWARRRRRGYAATPFAARGPVRPSPLFLVVIALTALGAGWALDAEQMQALNEASDNGIPSPYGEIIRGQRRR